MLRPEQSLSPDQQAHLDEQAQWLTHKLDEIQETENKVIELKAVLQEMEEERRSSETVQSSQGKRIGTPRSRVRVKGQDEEANFASPDPTNRLRSSTNTPLHRSQRPVTAAEPPPPPPPPRAPSPPPAVVAEIQRLRKELEQSEEQLGEALQAAQAAQEDLRTREKDLAEAEKQLRQKDEQLVRCQESLSSLREEHENVLKDLSYYKSLSEMRPSRAMEDRRVQEIHNETSRQRLMAEDLQVRNNLLNKELEERLKQITQLTDNLIASQQEAERWKTRAREQQADHQQRLSQLEDDLRMSRDQIEDLRRDSRRYQAERDHYQACLRRAEADLNAIVKAKRDTPVKPIHFSARSTKHRMAKRNSYLEVASTDSEDPADSRELEGGSSPVATTGATPKGLKSRGSIFRRSATKGDRLPPLGHLERKAGEIMAHILMEELSESKVKSVQAASSKIDALKEACIRAVLRLLHSNGSSISTNDSAESSVLEAEDVSPFQLLGSRDYLSKLVAETYNNMAVLEDAEDIKQEIKQLEVSSHTNVSVGRIVFMLFAAVVLNRM